MENPFNGGQLDFEDWNSLGIVVRLKVEGDVRQYNPTWIHYQRRDFVAHRLELRKKKTEVTFSTLGCATVIVVYVSIMCKIF